MTNEELFTDLKQLIEATVSQQTSHLATKDDINSVRTELKADISSLDTKLDTIQDAIADTLTHTTEALDTPPFRITNNGFVAWSGVLCREEPSRVSRIPGLRNLSFQSSV